MSPVDDVEFAAFMRGRYSALLRTATFLMSDRQLGEDLVQASLFKTAQRWRRLRDPAAAEAYTRVVMVRQAGHFRRRRWRGERPTALLHGEEQGQPWAGAAATAGSAVPCTGGTGGRSVTGPEEELRDLFGVLAARQPAGSTDGAWLRERWGRRHRRRAALLAAGVTAVALAVGTAVALPGGEGEQSLVATQPSGYASPSTSPSAAVPVPSPPASPAVSPPAPPLLTSTTGVRLLVVQGDDLALLEVDTGRTASRATPGNLRGYSRINATAVGREVVLVGDDSTGAGGGGGEVHATSGGAGAMTRVIGSSDPHLHESSRRGRIWLSSVTDADRTTGRPRTKLTEVDLRGRVRQRVDFDGVFGAYPFGDGFLRDVSLERDSGVELVDAQGRRSRVWADQRLLGVWQGRALLGDAAACTRACGFRLLTAAGPPAEQRFLVQDPASSTGRPAASAPTGRSCSALCRKATSRASGSRVRSWPPGPSRSSTGSARRATTGSPRRSAPTGGGCSSRTPMRPTSTPTTSSSGASTACGASSRTSAPWSSSSDVPDSRTGRCPAPAWRRARPGLR